VTQTAQGFLVFFLKKRELRHRRFRSIPRNPISYVNTGFPTQPQFAKNWCKCQELVTDGYPPARCGAYS